jgi:hypothetical protein
MWQFIFRQFFTHIGILILHSKQPISGREVTCITIGLRKTNSVPALMVFIKKDTGVLNAHTSKKFPYTAKRHLQLSLAPSHFT